ncbi:hypothetical protein J2W56_003994 [Nocardia kruczakiae]|uniref:Uncharacterized protein n=1 Tax=Nocardia kruczakiae TaxID=261477 RepID=A0ABU1XI77_9NOCA|nr:hypothetical protein [Nocardia kruczakiae]MDR7170243.1 hypothetical protein [Nocardia kruczakiae]
MSVEQREYDDDPVIEDPRPDVPDADDRPGRERIVGLAQGGSCGSAGCRERGYRPYATHRPTCAAPPGSGGLTSRKIFWHNIIGEIGRHRP